MLSPTQQGRICPELDQEKIATSLWGGFFMGKEINIHSSAREGLRKKKEAPFREAYGGISGNVEAQNFLEAPDFRRSDPWSVHMRRTIEKVRDKGGFTGNLIEAGVGDGRNIITAIDASRSDRLGKIDKIVGVDVDNWRLDLARKNFTTAGIPPEKYELYSGGIVNYLLKRPEKDKITGWGIACLPQAPIGETVNHADGADPKVDSLGIAKGMQLNGNSVDTYGLTLNAAFLTALGKRVDQKDFNLLIILSDRIPPNAREELFRSTGWGIQDEHKTNAPIQQDRDTGVAYVSKYDDFERFYQKKMDGRFEPIYAKEAERRRVDCLRTAGEELNVYHHLSVYHVSPETGFRSGARGGVIYERE